MLISIINPRIGFLDWAEYSKVCQPKLQKIFWKLNLGKFGVLLNDDIVALVTDGASVMIKMGKLSKPLHQLCYAHAIHLAVCEILYDSSNNNDIELPASSSEIMPNPPDDSELGEDILDDMLNYSEICDPNDADLIIPILKHHLNLFISKVRRITKMFTKSPTKMIYCKTMLKKFEMERN